MTTIKILIDAFIYFIRRFEVLFLSIASIILYILAYKYGKKTGNKIMRFLEGFKR